jgi:hypothetical protein
MNSFPENLELELQFQPAPASPPPSPRPPLKQELAAFTEFGLPTRELITSTPAFDGEVLSVATYVNEFWTAKQRDAHSLHEVSYRACFKPQLPRFFIERLTMPGEVVYDPFMGRGTTLVEAALLGRVPFGCDVNPVSLALTRPRLSPPSLACVARRLQEIDFGGPGETPEDLLVFYHPETLREICALRKYLLTRAAQGVIDAEDDWIRMVALNRLTGHSPGFFSVYTLPPNQAVSIKSQIKINARRKQTPPRRHVPDLILKKSRKLLQDFTPLAKPNRSDAQSKLVNGLAHHTPGIQSGSVSLVVTSPPFLDLVDYAGDNWLRCWFLGIDPGSVQLTVPGKLEHWQEAMTAVFHELHRVLKPGGHVAFEVGEVRGGTIKLEEAVLRCGVAAGLDPVLVLINAQEFTKTANCWGVDNNSKGTNTNRIVLFRKKDI